MVWTLFAFFTYNAESIEQLKVFFFISITCVFIFFPLQNFFVRLLTGKLSIYYIIFFAVPALFFAVKNGDGTVTFSDFYRNGNGWVFVSAHGTLWNTLWLVYVGICFGTAIFYLILWYKRSLLKREKKLIRLLIVASTISMALITIEYLLHDKLPAFRTVSLSPIFFVPWVAGYVFAVKRYQLLNITSEKVTRRILEAIDEFVVLISPENKVTYVNPKAVQFFGNPLHTIEQVKLNRFFPKVYTKAHAKAPEMEPEKEVSIEEESEVETLLPTIYEEGTIKKRMVLRLSEGDEERKIVDIEITRVFDRFNDPLGYLIIGKEVRSLEKLHTTFDLTEREIEVVGCIINGWKTQEIAAHLNITQRTVKAHITNIYQKLGVTNRISLINMIIEGDV
jgi:DNA-binding CsgD family transcriptional regulator